jgi:hypothetical protein
MPNVYTPELITELKQLTKGLPRAEGVKAIGRHLNLSSRAARAAYSNYMEKTTTQDAAVTPEIPAAETEAPPKSQGAHMSFAGDFGEVDLVTDNPRSLDDLIKACRVDLTVWEVERYVVNKWEMGRKAKTVNMSWKDGVASGSVEDTGGITKAPLWQVKAWLRRKVEASTINQMLEKFMGDAKLHAPKKFDIAPSMGQKGDCCYVLNIQDTHLAKLACHDETGGANWDIRIAEQAYRQTVEELIAKVPQDRVEQVVVIIGSDLLQVDNDKSSTTAGTYVDSDTRLSKAFDVAAKMLSDVIEELASRFKVHCVVYGGNHDRTVSLFLGRYIEAWFRNHPNVHVDAAPRSRKYYSYGKTLIAFDHGDETKHKDLPLSIMRDNQTTISRYRFMECLVGHLHSEQSQDIKGIVIRVAPALCPPDKWHSAKSFTNNMRRSQGLLYQRDDGLECIYYSRSLD